MFDWTKVEGYREDMTAEEKLELINNLPDPEPQPPVDDKAGNKAYVTKTKFDEVSSQLAEAKRQLKSRMSEDEQKEMERQVRVTEMESELNELRKEKKIASFKASYLAQGFAEELADKAALAMADGDTDTVFAVMKQQAANAEKALRAQILKDSPKPPSGEGANEEAKKKAEQEKLRKYFGLD